MRCAVHFAAILLPLLAAPAAGGPDESRRLAAGEVLVAFAGTSPRDAIGRGVIEAPPERVWRALTDYAHWEEFMPFLERSEWRHGTRESFQVMDLPAPFGVRRFRVRFTEGRDATPEGTVWRIAWSSVPGSGDVRDHHGAWTLKTFGPGRTLASCRLYTDPRGGVPRWAMDRATAKMLPWIFHGLRQHVRRSRYEGT